MADMPPACRNGCSIDVTSDLSRVTAPRPAKGNVTLTAWIRGSTVAAMRPGMAVPWCFHFLHFVTFEAPGQARVREEAVAREGDKVHAVRAHIEGNSGDAWPGGRSQRNDCGHDASDDKEANQLSH